MYFYLNCLFIKYVLEGLQDTIALRVQGVHVQYKVMSFGGL